MRVILAHLASHVVSLVIDAQNFALTGTDLGQSMVDDSFIALRLVIAYVVSVAISPYLVEIFQAK